MDNGQPRNYQLSLGIAIRVGVLYVGKFRALPVNVIVMGTEKLGVVINFRRDGLDISFDLKVVVLYLDQGLHHGCIPLVSSH